MFGVKVWVVYICRAIYFLA